MNIYHIYVQYDDKKIPRKASAGILAKDEAEAIKKFRDFFDADEHRELHVTKLDLPYMMTVVL